MNLIYEVRASTPIRRKAFHWRWLALACALGWMLRGYWNVRVIDSTGKIWYRNS